MPQTQVTLGLPESKALARQHILACLSHCGVKEMLVFHWFYKGKQETTRILCPSPPRFMRWQGFAWRTIENARDFNDFQGFCSRIRWRPKSAISFSQCLLFPKSLFFQGFSTVSGKPSGSLFLASALCAKGLFYKGFGTFCEGTFLAS